MISVHESQIISDDLNDQYCTWSFSKKLNNIDVEYCSIYANTPYINEITDIDSKKIQSKIFNCMKTIETSRINPLNVDIYKYIPDHIMEEYIEYHNKVCDHIIANYTKPQDYEFVKNLIESLDLISKRSLNITDKSMVEKFGNQIVLHPFTKTGRLGTCHKTFPILSLKKEDRVHIKPKNHFFLELDHNAAEIRTLMYLCDIDQPSEDAYMFLNKECFNSMSSRDDIKKMIITKFYSGSDDLGNLSKLFDLNKLKNEYYFEDHVITPFGKKIKSDGFHFLNYLTQSTFSYVFFLQMMKIQQFLLKRKSFVSFPLHDCIVIDLHEDDFHLVKDMVEIYQDTVFGKFMVNKKLGYNYLEMSKI